MDVFEVVDRLEVLRGSSSLSTSNKREIEVMYRDVLGKEFLKTSCSDCYRDAIIEMYLYLKRTGKMKEKSNYTLKNGVLLQSEFGSNVMYTNANLTDEVAEVYLANNPNGIIFFASNPVDWEERVKNRSNPKQELNEALVNEIVLALRESVTLTSIRETFKEYEIEGKKVTGKALNAHIEAAKLLV